VHFASHVRDDGSTLLVLSGEIDVACADSVRDTGLELLAAPNCHTLVIDMMDVSFLDSTGLSVLVALRNASGEVGAPIVLLDPSPRVMRVLEITALDGVFDIRRTGQPTA
jgi:anti-sigma B factor antagonist